MNTTAIEFQVSDEIAVDQLAVRDLAEIELFLVGGGDAVITSR